MATCCQMGMELHQPIIPVVVDPIGFMVVGAMVPDVVVVIWPCDEAIRKAQKPIERRTTLENSILTSVL